MFSRSCCRLHFFFVCTFICHSAHEYGEVVCCTQKNKVEKYEDVEVALFADLTSHCIIITLILSVQELLIAMRFGLMPILCSQRPHFLPSLIQCFDHILRQCSLIEVLQILLQMLRTVLTISIPFLIVTLVIQHSPTRTDQDSIRILLP